MYKLIFWLIVFSIIWFIIKIASDTLVPFVAAFIIAYILRPLVNAVSHNCNMPNNIASNLILLIVLSIFIIAFTLLFPSVYKQTSVLINKIPVYKSYIQTELMPALTQKLNNVDPNIAYDIKNSVDNFLNILFSIISGIFNNIWGYTLATMYAFMLLTVVPVLLFYFLRDWSKMGNYITELLPPRNKQKILSTVADINQLLSAYMRGQLNVCLLLSGYYCIVLALIGVDLSLLLGILSGFLIIIPFIGVFFAFSLVIVISYFSFGLSIKLLYVSIAYVVGYSVESCILSPKIIGDQIGLHPMWVIFAVFACGTLFGFWGIFFAIPIAGIAKILLCTALDWYKSSRFYS